MSRLSTGINPFRPGAGAKPPLLAGRDRELAVAERKLDELTSGQTPSQGILFWGPRGNGKTALLDRIAAMAREQGMRAERLPVPALTSDDRLVRDLQERVGLHDSRVTGVQIAGTGATSRPADPTGSVPALLRAWITAVGSPLVILVDEAHTVAPDAGMSLFDAVQQAGATTPPFLLVVAGTPGVRARLRNAGTFTERQFERMPIGRLDPEATREGLMQPARDSGHPFSREALALLAAASQDYPFFVQLLGSAAWDAAQEAGESVISEDSARRGVANSRRPIGIFYGDRFAEARRRGIHAALRPLASSIKAADGGLREGALEVVLAGAARRCAGAFESAQLWSHLEDLGILWEIRDAIWEIGIPSFGDYVLDRDARAQPS